MAKEPSVVKSKLIVDWKPHRVKQGDGKGGWVYHDAEYARIGIGDGKYRPPVPGYGGCAFGLVRMEHDRVALVASETRRIGDRSTERPVMAVSEDGGRTWGDFTVVPDHSVPSHRPMTATYLGKGKLLIPTHGTPPRRHFTNDYGKTWEYLDVPRPPEGATMADEGDQLVDRDASGMATKIAEFRNNRWLVDKGSAPWRTRDVSGRIAWSTDGGRTWKDEAELDEWHYQETHEGKTYRRGFGGCSFARASNGWIVAGLSTDIPVKYSYDPPCRDNFCGTAVSVSKDDGKTWTRPEILFAAGRLHPSVQVLPNGNVLLTVIVRIDIEDGKLASYRHGCEAVMSVDNGLTWDLERKYVIDEFEYGRGYSEKNGYQGYQCIAGHIATTSLSDGTVLTSYGNYLVEGMPLVRWIPA